MNTLILPIDVAQIYTTNIRHFQAELITRWKASDTEARQALYLMLIQGPAPYGHLRIVLGEHAPAITRIAQKAGMRVIPVQVGGEVGVALPPLTAAIREAWPGPVML